MGSSRAQKVIADPCNEKNFRIDVGALEKYEPRLRRACNKIVSDKQSFGRALWENLPKMMFMFLPLIALVMAVLYLGSGRYYVEHLLFFLHYHAFFFLAGIVVLLLDRFGAATTGAVSGFFGTAEGFVIAALVFYVPVYLFLAMRRVYGQGRVSTATKFCFQAQSDPGGGTIRSTTPFGNCSCTFQEDGGIDDALASCVPASRAASRCNSVSR
jgi:hypothetical protein